MVTRRCGPEDRSCSRRLPRAGWPTALGPVSVGSRLAPEPSTTVTPLEAELSGASMRRWDLLLAAPGATSQIAKPRPRRHDARRLADKSGRRCGRDAYRTRSPREPRPADDLAASSSPGDQDRGRVHDVGYGRTSATTRILVFATRGGGAMATWTPMQPKADRAGAINVSYPLATHTDDRSN